MSPVFATTLLALLSLSSLSFAAPATADLTTALKTDASRRPIAAPSCSLKGKSTDLVAGLAVNAGETPNYVFVGRGTQNYTCGPASTYVSAGAVADFYDASCLISYPNAGSTLAPLALRTLPYPLPANTPFVPTAKHFFKKNADGTTNPVFKLTSTGQEFVGKKVAGVDAPKDPKTNIQWLQLGLISGDLGKTFYRVDTAGGQPPASCNPADTTVKTVPYAAIYWSYH